MSSTPAETSSSSPIRASKLVARDLLRSIVTTSGGPDESSSIRFATIWLAQLGVDKIKIADTSRGKLDATGTDEAGWARDRRIDILLQ